MKIHSTCSDISKNVHQSLVKVSKYIMFYAFYKYVVNFVVCGCFCCCWEICFLKKLHHRKYSMKVFLFDFVFYFSFFVFQKIWTKKCSTLSQFEYFFFCIFMFFFSFYFWIDIYFVCFSFNANKFSYFHSIFGDSLFCFKSLLLQLCFFTTI